MIDLASALHANEAVVPQIYEAAVHPDRWPNVIREIAEFSASFAGMISISYPASRRGEIVAESGLGDDVVTTWEARFGINEWTDIASATPVGELLHAAETVSVEEMSRTDMGRELLGPLAIADVAGMRLSESKLFIAVLSTYARQIYDDAALDRLRFLSPHIARSPALHQRLSSMSMKTAALERTLDDLMAGIVLVDARGACLHANLSARAIFEEGDGLSLRDGVVSCRNAQDQSRLTNAVETALTGAADASDHGLFRIVRPSGRRPYHVVVSPAVPGLLDPGRTQATMLWITDPERESAPTAGALELLLGLTPAESRVAAAIVAGKTIKEFASEAGTAEGSARWTLKQVLSKTGVARQSELIRLVMNSVPSPPC